VAIRREHDQGSPATAVPSAGVCVHVRVCVRVCVYVCVQVCVYVSADVCVCVVYLCHCLSFVVHVSDCGCVYENVI
jgi:hypothetical protein